MSLKDKITVEWTTRKGTPFMAARASIILQRGQIVDKYVLNMGDDFKSRIEDELKEGIMHSVYGDIHTPLRELQILAHRGDMCGVQYYHEKIEALADEILKITQDKK